MVSSGEYRANTHVRDEVEGKSEPEGRDDDDAELHATGDRALRRPDQERMKRRANRARAGTKAGRSKRLS